MKRIFAILILVAVSFAGLPWNPQEVNYYTNATSINGARSATASGNYLYVVSGDGNSLATFNITNPATPVQMAYYTNATSLNYPTAATASGNYLYVVSYAGESLTTFNITNPSIPVQTDYYTDATSLSGPDGPYSATASGNYLYVVSYAGKTLTTFNITNLATPVQMAYYTNATSLNRPTSATASGNYLYVVSYAGNSLTTFNITNPSNLVQTAYYTDATSLNRAYSATASGNYLYVVSVYGNSLTAFNITNPSIPVQTAYYTNATSLNGPNSATASGNYLYVVSTGKSLTTFNITNPATPVQMAYYANMTSLNGSYSATASGNYLYVASIAGDSLTTFDISPLPPQLIASNFSANYGSTNFSAVPDLSNITNLTLATQKGKIKFAENHAVNASGQDYNSQVVIGNGFISVNSSGLSQTFNNSATLTLNNVSCPATVYYASGFFNSSEDVLAEKKICNSSTDPSCTNITCSGGNLTFTVSHFTGFAYGATANLTIWDETDSGMPYGNQIRYISQNTRFFANYSNSSSEPITGATCQIWFSDSGWNSMSWNSTNLYEYTRTFTSGGSFNWNVSCNKSGQATLDANDSVFVNSTIAVVLNSPADNAIVKSSVILYNWSVYGFPEDPSCNLTRNGSVVYSATCTNNALCGYTNTTANGEYIWNVTCNSGATTRTSSTRALTVNTLYHSTNVEGVLNMNITEISSISLPQNSISFGTVEITQTYDSYPSQFFVIKNDGNTIVDIEVNATNPFLSSNCTSLPCTAYQVKVGANETIPYPICSGNPSKESYTNMFGATSGLLINNLNFVDNDDSANIYIKFRLPNDEPPGSKSSTVTFWAKSANSYACD